MRCIVLLLVATTAISCRERREPPGAARSSSARAIEIVAPEDGWHRPSSGEGSPGIVARPGSPEDNLPFSPTGERIASIAWRTWVYTDVGPQRTRYGYLRAGAVVDARGPAIENSGCVGGWYRVNPRGFVCVGKGATTEVESEPLVRALAVRPERGPGLPYRYVMADEHEPPYLYFRLPNPEEVATVEGPTVPRDVASWRARERVRGGLEALGEPTSPPAFLSTQVGVEKPYGVKRRLHYSVHAGRASPESGFALLHVFDWHERSYGLTTELDILPLDRTDPVVPSTFHGVELLEGESLPVGVVRGYSLRRHSLDGGQLVPTGSYEYRQWVKLTGAENTHGITLLETRDGGYVSRVGLRMIEPRESYPSFATGTRKWIDISIKHQTLVAYAGRKPVYATLVSTGRGGMGDPEKVPATVRGTFMVHSKHISATMDGEEDSAADSYALQDVPFVQYFHKGFALHGTYWHDEFGKVRSHGCVNLAPADAAWLFEWTDPVVPPGWHGVLNKSRGTVVYVHH